MDLSKLKTLSKGAQIVVLIEKAATFGGKIWQNLPAGRKVLHLANIQADMGSDDVTFKLIYLDELDPALPIFVNLCYRNIIFKLDPGSYKVRGDKLICPYPTDVRALDPRNGDRYVFPVQSDISLSLTRKEGKGRKSYDIEVRILDVSEKGFGIIISGKNADFLRFGEQFIVTAINNKPLRNEIQGFVTYVAPRGHFQKKGDMRVGLSLSTALDDDMFEYLKKKCEIILSA